MSSDNIFKINERSKVTDEKIIQVKELCVSFKQKWFKKERKKVLNKASFELHKGETLAIIGENGAGKTVLMETILGLYEKDSGDIILSLGHDYYYDNLKEIGMQFQDAKFSHKNKVKELIKFYKNFYKDRVNDVQLNEMIDVFGVKNWMNQKINKLSGGQKQRINLMLAIITNPRVMILDEFVTGLDVNSVIKIINYVNKLKIKNGASMIIISHHPDEIEALADRILVLKEGRFIEETTIKKIQKKQSVVRYISEITKNDIPKNDIPKNKSEKENYEGRGEF